MDALLSDLYKPDYSAKVINNARLLKIRRKDYVAALNQQFY